MNTFSVPPDFLDSSEPGIGFPSLAANLSLVIGTGLSLIGFIFSVGSSGNWLLLTVTVVVGTGATEVRGGGEVGGENGGETKCV